MALELDASTHIIVASVLACHLWWWIALGIMRVAQFEQSAAAEATQTNPPATATRHALIYAEQASPGSSPSGSKSKPVKYDNGDPTGSKAALSGYGKRALLTMNNHAEQFGFFAAAAGLSVATRGPADGSMIIAIMSAAYALLRLAHLLCYVNDYPTARSFCFLFGALDVIAMYGLVLGGL